MAQKSLHGGKAAALMNEYYRRCLLCRLENSRAPIMRAMGGRACTVLQCCHCVLFAHGACALSGNVCSLLTTLIERMIDIEMVLQ